MPLITQSDWQWQRYKPHQTHSDWWWQRYKLHQTHSDGDSDTSLTKHTVTDGDSYTSLTKHNDLRTATGIQDKFSISLKDAMPAVDLQVFNLTNHQPSTKKMTNSELQGHFLMLCWQSGTLSLTKLGHPAPSHPSNHHLKLIFFSSPTDCVCVCVRERERERELVVYRKVWDFFPHLFCFM